MDCLACGRPAPIPAAGTVSTPARAVSTARRPSVPKKPPSRPDGWRSLARWSLVAALIPLAFYTLGAPEDLKSRAEETRRLYPELTKKFQGHNFSEEELAVLPSHRYEGAALARTTSAHWIVAILAALIFWEFILIIQPMGNSTSKQLWAVGVFTGTVGILMLLVVQVAAFISTAVTGVGGCAIMLFIFALKFIGYSYRAALDPGNGFIASMLGFTFGVGLMEEFFKALPLYWHFRKSATLDVRGAVVWGLATGIGFGVSEGISYCRNFYNGISGGGMYVVRFSSCVALHAVWSATAAILIWRRQNSLQGLERWYQWIPTMISTLWISMALHGFYDTCLKKSYGAASLAGALLSFALFFWLYDRACREELGQKSAIAVNV